MAERTLQVENPTGLHARPASLLVQAAQGFQSDVTIVAPRGEGDAKSILDVLSLGVEAGQSITLRTSGPDEVQALEALARLMKSGLGEDSKPI